jgi:hypothetical protein
MMMLGLCLENAKLPWGWLSAEGILGIAVTVSFGFLVSWRSLAIK